MKQTIISSPHYSLCSIKEKLNDQRKMLFSWWLSLSNLLRCVWNDLTLGAWCWHGIASVRKGGGVTHGPATQSSQNRHQDRWSRQIRGQGGQEGRKGPTATRLWLQRNEAREDKPCLAPTRPSRGQKVGSDHVSNLHSRVHWVLFEMPSSIIDVIFLH